MYIAREKGYMAYLLRLGALALAVLGRTAVADTHLYDSLHRLTRVERDDGTVITYEYDELGNRTRKRVTVPTPALASALPNSVDADQGSTRVLLVGDHFRRSSTAVLRGGDTTIPPESVEVISPREIAATFFLTEAHIGCWDVVVQTPPSADSVLAGAVCVTTSAPPEAPPCLVLPDTVCTGAEADVSWCAVERAESYELELRRAGEPIWTNVCSVDHPATSCRITAESPGDLDVRVRATNAAGPGPWREGQQAVRVLRTVELVDPPMQPASACVGSIVRVQWTPHPDAVRYRIDLSRDGTSVTSATVDHPTSQWSFPPDTIGSWSVSIVAENECGLGTAITSAEPILVVGPPPSPPSLDLPTNACVGDAVPVQADPVAGATEYALEVSVSDDPWDRVAVANLPTFAYALDSAGDRRFRVVASNDCGESAPGPSAVGVALVVLRTPGPIPGGPAHATEACSGDAVTVSWPCDPDADSYDVEVCPAGQACVTVATGLRECSLQFGPVGPGELSFRVRGVSACGRGEWAASSAPLIVSDDPPVPRLRSSVVIACLGQEVVFDEVSGVEFSSYEWDLGDGNTSSARTVRHAFATCGTHEIVLTTETSCGTSRSEPLAIRVVCAIDELSCTLDVERCVVELSWAPLPDTDGLELRVLRDGVEIGRVAASETRFEDDDAPEGQHTYEVVPASGETACGLSGASCSVEVFCPREPCDHCRDDPDNPISVAFSSENIRGGAAFDERLALDGACGTEILLESSAGRIGRGVVFANLVSLLPAGAGLQGWSISVEVEGDVDIASVTTDGTVVAPVPEGIQSGGFEKSEVVSPDRNDGRRGAVSAVVLSFVEPARLDPVVTESVLSLSLETARNVAEGEEVSGRLAFRSGLRGSGQPVQAYFASDDDSFDACNADEADTTVTFLGVPASGFRRGDVNGDGPVEISDAVGLLCFLFLGCEPLPCPAAADSNDNEEIDLADAVFILNWLFLGGGPPPSPGPHDCGVDPTPSEFGECEYRSC